MKMKVLVTGASGFLGTRLQQHLAERGHEPLCVSRQRSSEGYDWSDESLEAGVEAADAVVHLAGENLFSRRWTAKQKEILISSRLDTTRRLAALVAEHRPSVFVCASAVGFYGPSTRLGLDESSPPGDDFLARLCADWESAAGPAREAGIRTLSARIGVILGRGGGALQRMLPPFRLGLGGALGSGRQWVSWIHIDDAAHLLSFLLESEAAEGTFNLTAPNPVTMTELANSLGSALHRPTLFKVPAIALRLALGEVADVLLTGQSVLPRRAQELGYRFAFTDVGEAMRDLVAS